MEAGGGVTNLRLAGVPLMYSVNVFDPNLARTPLRGGEGCNFHQAAVWCT